MNAELLFEEKTVLEDGSIIEVRIWVVPAPVPPTTHGYKYRLFFGRPGLRLVSFDSERGKGDHKHVLGTETPYSFLSVAQLLRDFRAEVEAMRGKAI